MTNSHLVSTIFIDPDASACRRLVPGPTVDPWACSSPSFEHLEERIYHTFLAVRWFAGASRLIATAEQERQSDEAVVFRPRNCGSAERN